MSYSMYKVFANKYKSSVKKILLKYKKNKVFQVAIAKPQNWDTVVKQIDAKEISVSQALQALNISRSSYYRLRQNNPF